MSKLRPCKTKLKSEIVPLLSEKMAKENPRKYIDASNKRLRDIALSELEDK